jgi:anti-sigma factor RsiW
MKPCFGKRKDIVLLAANSLGPARKTELRAHLDSCARCRAYLEEITNVTEAIAVCLPNAEGEPSNLFHANLMDAVNRSAPSGRRQKTVFDWIQFWTLPAAAAAVLLMIAGWIVTKPHSKVVPSAPMPKLDLSPTFANYETAVSLDKLDELLKEQVNRNREPLPIYTAGVPGANLTD